MLQAAEDFTTSGTDWRLPTIKELESLMDYDCNNMRNATATVIMNASDNLPIVSSTPFLDEDAGAKVNHVWVIDPDELVNPLKTLDSATFNTTSMQYYLVK